MIAGARHRPAGRGRAWRYSSGADPSHYAEPADIIYVLNFELYQRKVVEINPSNCAFLVHFEIKRSPRIGAGGDQFAPSK